MSKIFLALPTYDGRIDTGTAFGALVWSSQKHELVPIARGGSLLNGNCNLLLCEALNSGAEWLAMLHADIEPERWWLDTLIDEAGRCGADMLSAVVPLKDGRGVTSTAIASDAFAASGGSPSDIHGCRQFGRLTLNQIYHPSFPRTFGIEQVADALESIEEPLSVADVPRHALLLNTGCMIVRLRHNWDWEQVYFSTVDGIVREESGRFRSFDCSEDWLFSWRVAQQGGRCMATKAMSVTHKGMAAFPSGQAWGSLATDCNYCQKTEAAA